MQIQTDIQVKILDQRMGRDFSLPEYKTEGAAGLDLLALPETNLILSPGETKLIPTGISIYIENPNLCAVIIPRSGLGAKQGIVLGNLVGLIDSDYQGPLMLAVWNRSSKDFTIEPGARLAQLVFLPIIRASLKITKEFKKTDRGQGGFGSTGV